MKLILSRQYIVSRLLAEEFIECKWWEKCESLIESGGGESSIACFSAAAAELRTAASLERSQWVVRRAVSETHLTTPRVT